MKQFSIVLNLLLVVAVGILYYLHFSGKPKTKPANSLITAGVKDSGSSAGRTIVAYVELDSLNNNVTFIKQRKKELEAEQKEIMSDYENSYRGMEAEKNEFIKRGNAITQQEAEAFEMKLRQKQQDVETSKQMKGQKLAEKGAKIMEDMQAKLKVFMNDYNKDKHYTYILATGTGLDYLFYKDSTLNITNEIVAGLNEQMKSQGKQ